MNDGVINLQIAETSFLKLYACQKVLKMINRINIAVEILFSWYMTVEIL